MGAVAYHKSTMVGSVSKRIHLTHASTQPLRAARFAGAQGNEDAARTNVSDGVHVSPAPPASSPSLLTSVAQAATKGAVLEVASELVGGPAVAAACILCSALNHPLTPWHVTPERIRVVVPALRFEKDREPQVTQMFSKTPGVTGVELHAASACVIVHCRPNSVELSQVLATLKKNGLAVAQPPSNKSDATGHPVARAVAEHASGYLTAALIDTLTAV